MHIFSFLRTANKYATSMDSIMNYPLYYGMMDAFQLPGPANISSLVEVMTAVNTSLPVRVPFPASLCPDEHS